MVVTRQTNCYIERIRAVLSKTDYAEAVFAKFTFRDFRQSVEEFCGHSESEARADVVICVECVECLNQRWKVGFEVEIRVLNEIVKRSYQTQISSLSSS